MFVLGVNERWEAGYLGAWIFTIFNKVSSELSARTRTAKGIKSGPEASRRGNLVKQEKWGLTYSAMSMAHMPVPHPRSSTRNSEFWSNCSGAVCSFPFLATSKIL
jgi:hypothetical protein